MAQPLRRQGLRRRLSRRPHRRGARPGHRGLGRRGGAHLLQRRARDRVRGGARPAGRARALPGAGAGGGGRGGRAGRQIRSSWLPAPPRPETSPGAAGRACRRRRRARCSRSPTPPGGSWPAAPAEPATSCSPAPGARRLEPADALAGHPARARLRAHRQHRERARPPGGARRAAPGRPGAAPARRRGGDGADRRDGGRSPEGGAGRGARGGRLRRRTSPNASTFMAATGARLVGPTCRTACTWRGLDRGRRWCRWRSTVIAYSVAFGQLQDVNAARGRPAGGGRRSRAAGGRAPARQHDPGLGRAGGAAAGHRACRTCWPDG